MPQDLLPGIFKESAKGIVNVNDAKSWVGFANLRNDHDIVRGIHDLLKHKLARCFRSDY